MIDKKRSIQTAGDLVEKYYQKSPDDFGTSKAATYGEKKATSFVLKKIVKILNKLDYWIEVGISLEDSTYIEENSCEIEDYIAEIEGLKEELQKVI